MFSTALESEVIIDQDDFYTSLRERLFCDGPCVTNALWGIAVHAVSGFDTRSLHIETHGVHRGHIFFDTIHRCGKVSAQFIAGEENYYILGAELNGSSAITEHIEIHEVSFFGHGIGAAEKTIDKQSLAAEFIFFFRR